MSELLTDFKKKKLLDLMLFCFTHSDSSTLTIQ